MQTDLSIFLPLGFLCLALSVIFERICEHSDRVSMTESAYTTAIVMSSVLILIGALQILSINGGGSIYIAAGYGIAFLIYMGIPALVWLGVVKKRRSNHALMSLYKIWGVKYSMFIGGIIMNLLVTSIIFILTGASAESLVACTIIHVILFLTLTIVVLRKEIGKREKEGDYIDQNT